VDDRDFFFIPLTRVPCGSEKIQCANPGQRSGRSRAWSDHSEHSDISRAATVTAQAVGDATCAATVIARAATVIARAATVIARAATVIARAATVIARAATVIARTAIIVSRAVVVIARTATVVSRAVIVIARADTIPCLLAAIVSSCDFYLGRAARYMARRSGLSKNASSAAARILPMVACTRC